MSGVILETDADRSLERRTMQRIMEKSKDTAVAVKLPALSAIDYLVSVDGILVAGIEIKTRKESMEKIQSYGGLMLKHRKVVELNGLSESLQAPMIVAFAFDNGEGPVMFASTKQLDTLEPVPPPPRRNFRALACDDEYVVFLDWDKHLLRYL